MSSKSGSDKVFLYRKFDLQALCRRASALRRGVPCVCDPEQHPASGSFNWAVFISFEDGVRWVFRAPHPRDFMPEEQAEKLLASEAATLRYLKAHSDIPVPEVYEYCASSDNDIGVPFILMNEAPGRPLSNFWKASEAFQPSLETAKKNKILSQLGAITWKLSQLRFDKIGSLFEEAGSFELKECLSRGHMLRGRYLLEIPRGPFVSETEFYDSLVSAFSEHAETLPISPNCFVAPIPTPVEYQSSIQCKKAVGLWNDFVTIGNKIDTANNRVDYVVVADALRDILRTLELPAVNPGTFPLHHPDLSANNIFVDDDCNITCLIDWSFASSIPEATLLTMPGLPQYGDELCPQLQIPFIDGFIAAIPESTDQKLFQKYRESLELGQVAWALSRLLSLDSIRDYNLFANVWQFARGSDQDMGQYFLQKRCLPHYITLYNEVHEEDPPILEIEEEEKDYFRDKDFRKAIAMKLTLVSDWKRQYAEIQEPRLRENMFVASPVLWKWIHAFVQDWKEMLDRSTPEIRGEIE
ncbi:hypothetical protein N7509_000795 [Penicillium cosmopolitanum]|uniref:Aminoglycoside phosphotransferase domain-containing protein n=1 Tax=Penicillium cosmopolitanum TaxID=1131564 RepID=A0A9X0BEK3_9EURO|nr:uncharacterized protein N7509_000795 [Penicillium cosmopolitanum]KAJ5414168.1 hypothetical protein N7509_000795 [Penicillium cosmopolitanum]